MSDTVTIHDIRRAADRIRAVAVRTPLIENPALNARASGRVLVKPESLQRTGSFKIRGAYNRLAQLSDAEREAGVVAWSSGNHAQGVAAAAQLLGIHAAIVMPHDAPAIKRDNTLGFGAEIVGYDRYTEVRETIGERLARERGATLVPSYDDPHVIAGQGTVGLECIEQASERNAALDQLLICVSGGGLAAGIATAFDALSPKTALYSVEPAGFDDHARALGGEHAATNAPDARSICDALQAPTPGDVTFPINRRLLQGGIVVSDAEVRDAMRFAFEELKLVVEPGGAVALAAVLSGRIETRDRTTGVIISGGNVDRELMAMILGG